MGFKTFCDVKGCHKEMEPVLDRITNKVYCTECGKEINCVSEFMKRQLVSLGQTKSKKSEKIPYAVKCHICAKEDVPVVKGTKLFCRACDQELIQVPRPFAEIIRQKAKSRD